MKHGYSKHPLYSKFNQMKQRCYNKNSSFYPRYGGKGITICDEWLNDVSKFIEWAENNGYSKVNCSINRIDPKKGYSPDNCNFMTVSKNSAYHPDYSSNGFSISVYCRTEEIARMVREKAKQLNIENGMRPYSKSQTLTEKPQYIDTVPKTAFASYPVQLPKLPDFLVDIMNGGAFPAPEELTRAEQAILYDTQVNTLVNLYRQSKNNDLAQHIRERLDELGVDF